MPWFFAKIWFSGEIVNNTVALLHCYTVTLLHCYIVIVIVIVIVIAIVNVSQIIIPKGCKKVAWYKVPSNGGNSIKLRKERHYGSASGTTGE
jgi:hypothetical protein